MTLEQFGEQYGTIQNFIIAVSFIIILPVGIIIYNYRQNKRVTKKFLRKVGFTDIPHFTIAGNMIFDIGRKRQLSIGYIGTPNEMMVICEINEKNPKQIDDIIVLHNYDYDGYLTRSRIRELIKWFTV